MAMKKHKEATAQEQSCAVASFLFFRVERTDQNEDSADHIDCRDRSRARRPLGSSGSALVEARRVELLSESISARISPSAAADLNFAKQDAPRQASSSAIPSFPCASGSRHRVFLYN